MDRSCRVLMHRNDHRLHVKPVGTFDVEAAERLLGLLQTLGQKFTMVMVHTAGIEPSSPAGLNALGAGLERLGQTAFRLVFTGEYVPGSPAENGEDRDAKDRSAL